MKNKVEKSQVFTTKNEYTVEHMPLSDATDVSNFISGDKTHIIKYNKKTTITATGQKDKEASFTKQNLVSTEVLNKILANPENFDKITENDDAFSKNPIILVMNEFIDIYKAQGIYTVIDQMMGQKDGVKPHDFTEYNVFDNANEPGFMFVQFIDNEHSLRVIKDKDGNFTGEPMVFDYIGAKLDNGSYDLDVLIEYLMQRDDVAFITSDRYSYGKNRLLKCPLKGDEEGMQDIIADIPSYNSEEDRTETISLVYYPKSEDVIKMMNWKMSEEDKKNQVYGVDTYAVQTLLGCQKFRKDVKPEPVEPEPPKRKFKR
jgi:hypothetical protein